MVDRLLMDFGVGNRSNIYQKSIQKAIENKMQVGMDFGWLLDRFLVDLGAKLGVKLRPSWHQNRRKWGTKTMSKNHQKSGDAMVRGGPQGYARKSGPAPLPAKQLGTLPYRAGGPGPDIHIHIPRASPPAAGPPIDPPSSELRS